ncbi:phage tail tape measure protein [Parafrankia sp. EUN1f]|uniref:phage tail tape measure protein n=1 Tax=Parafrankia sp. EUN1f TaxID=102897 RepID=UPI0001C4557E|nr:phage tail tape measure protein [Parafrankia sp. EUN1f]EFC86469.1 phage tail tape measure protein, TP901 family [Parafrankia sp. EUN1f]
MGDQTRTLRVTIVGDAKNVKESGAQAENALSDVGDAADEASRRAGDAFSGIGTLAVAGLAAAAGQVSGLIADAIDQEGVIDRMNAQLGATGEFAQSMGSAAGNLYADGFGESIQDTADAVKAVWQNGLIPEDAADADIERVAGKLTDFASVFEQDTATVSGAVSTMLKTGLAKSADEAFDLLTRGMQQGVNKADDLMDTFTEYPTIFRALGLSGQETMGLLSQGLKAGARDSDTVADALKETTLMLQGMGQPTVDAVKALGLDSKTVQDAINAGGQTAHDTLGELIKRLGDVKDPTQKAQIELGLFGTKAEDLQGALDGLDLSTATRELGDTAGAMEQVNTTLNDNAGARLETFKRQVMSTFVDVVGNKIVPVIERRLIPALTGFATWVQNNQGPLKVIAVILTALLIPALISAGVQATISAAKQVAAWVSAQASAIASAASQVGALVMMGARWVWAGLQALASGAQMAAAWLIAIGPVAIVIAVIAGLVFLVIKYWDQIWGATVAVWNSVTGFIVGAAQGVVDWVRDHWKLILGFLTGPIGAAVIAIATHWTSIKNGGLAVLSWFQGLPASLTSALATVASILLAPFKAGFNAIAKAWNSSVGEISFKAPGWVPGIGGKGFSVPQIPMLAEGGVIQRAGLAVVGDGGEPEIVSLSRGAQVTPLSKVPASGGRAIHVSIQAGSVIAERDLTDKVRTAVREALRREGRELTV